MNVSISFTKRAWRWVGALIASFVTSFVGLYPGQFAHGEARDCSLQDVTAWQSQLTDPDEEISPPYILEVTEAFIQNCPDRPEIAEASRIAGVSAVHSGEAKRALLHFDNAGWIRDRHSMFAQAAAFLANGETEMGWVIRDEIVENWLRDLSRTPMTTVDAIAVQGGNIYAVNFTRIDDDTGLQAAWVAVPDGAGWPATLSIGSSRQGNAFHRLRAGEDAGDLRNIHLHRCLGRRLLAQSDAAISSIQFERTAKLALQAYLANPDTYETPPKGGINKCVMTHRLLPKAPR